LGGKDMEYKIKENVNVNSLTFKKKVLEETIDLMGVIRNYTHSDLEFNLMLGFLDNLIDGNSLLEALAHSTGLIAEIESKVEPLFNEVVVKNEEYYKVYNSLYNEMKDYAEREVANNHNITGLLYTLMDELGSLTQEEMMTAINQVVLWAANKFVPTQQAQKPQPKKEKEKTEVMPTEIQDKKMLELIEKFKNQGNITKE
jgi:hypothetical protein